jgi:hypothetical protein
VLLVAIRVTSRAHLITAAPVRIGEALQAYAATVVAVNDSSTARADMPELEIWIARQMRPRALARTFGDHG